MKDPHMTGTLRRFDPRLHIMMFMQCAVYGIWIPLAGVYLGTPVEQGGLGFSQDQKFLVLALAAGIGAFCAPFIAGQLADRYFPTQRCLGALLVIGGVIKFITAYQTSFTAWLFLSIGYAVAFIPTQALTNSLAMAHLSDPKRQFPGVRVFGTIGWITVAWAFPMIWLQEDLSLRWLPPFFTGTSLPDATSRIADAFKVAGVLSILYGLYCWFLLPNTPPNRKATKKLAFARAFALVRYRSFAVLILAALLMGMLHSVYFVQASPFLKSIGLDEAHIMPALSIGQFAEIIALALLGTMLGRFGFRAILTVGCCAFFLRYLIFGLGVFLPVEVVVGSLFLHGVCFACFVAAAFIYVDRIAPDDVRHSAQTTFMLIFFGASPLLAGLTMGPLSRLCTTDDELNYTAYWLTLSLVAAVGVALVWFVFRDQTEDA